MKELLFLVKNGIPYEVVKQLNRVQVKAYCIIIGELNGNKFNWSKLEFEKPA
jgi:hypothetical protein